MHILSPVTDNCPSWISRRRNESMWSDQVSNPGPLTYKSGALPTALRGPAVISVYNKLILWKNKSYNKLHISIHNSVFYIYVQSTEDHVIRQRMFDINLGCHLSSSISKVSDFFLIFPWHFTVVHRLFRSKCWFCSKYFYSAQTTCIT